MRTQVAIIGAGPAGLLLSHLLAARGVESTVLENRSRDYVEARLRAGILEQQTVDLLTDLGLAGRLHRDGLRHDGIYLQWPGTRHQIDFQQLCGRSVWVYGQTEVVKDLIGIGLDTGLSIEFGVTETEIHDVDTEQPWVSYVVADGTARRLDCQVVAGCDGFHGISRPAIPDVAQRIWERGYQFSWLGILAQTPPSTDELIYAWHPNGFAMHSMRSPRISRLYLQVDADDRIENWSDDRIWAELSTRMKLDGWTLTEGPIMEKSILPMRSFVSTPMRHGRLFLAGDATHIVPPTGAKGLNLAVADVALLADALDKLLIRGQTGPADAYSNNALKRIWRATHFSWWMTSMLHHSGDPFDAQLQLSQLRYIESSLAAATSLAENYTGMPLTGLDS